MSYKPIDSKRDQFRKYVENNGIVEMFSKVLIELMNNPVKPDNPIDFIRENLGATLKESMQIDHLQQEVDAYRKQVDELTRQLGEVTEKLASQQQEMPTTIADLSADSTLVAAPAAAAIELLPPIKVEKELATLVAEAAIASPVAEIPPSAVPADLAPAPAAVVQVAAVTTSSEPPIAVVEEAQPVAAAIAIAPSEPAKEAAAIAVAVPKPADEATEPIAAVAPAESPKVELTATVSIVPIVAAEEKAAAVEPVAAAIAQPAVTSSSNI